MLEQTPPWPALSQGYKATSSLRPSMCQEPPLKTITVPHSGDCITVRFLQDIHIFSNQNVDRNNQNAGHYTLN